MIPVRVKRQAQPCTSNHLAHNRNKNNNKIICTKTVTQLCRWPLKPKPDPTSMTAWSKTTMTNVNDHGRPLRANRMLLGLPRIPPSTIPSTKARIPIQQISKTVMTRPTLTRVRTITLSCEACLIKIEELDNLTPNCPYIQGQLLPNSLKAILTILPYFDKRKHLSRKRSPKSDIMYVLDWT